jgi:hypothetical protein
LTHTRYAAAFDVWANIGKHSLYRDFKNQIIENLFLAQGLQFPYATDKSTSFRKVHQLSRNPFAGVTS